MSDDEQVIHVADKDNREWTLCGIPTFPPTPPPDGTFVAHCEPEWPRGPVPFCETCRRIALDHNPKD